VKFASISNQDTKHEVRYDTLSNIPDSHNKSQADTPIGKQEDALDDLAKKVDAENEDEDEDDVICNGFNNHLNAEEDQSAFDTAHSLSGMSQEYIVDLLKHLKVCHLLDLFLSTHLLLRGHVYFILCEAYRERYVP
jgi:hypothetical protein